MKNSRKFFLWFIALFALFVTACSSSKDTAEGSNKSGELSGEIVVAFPTRTALGKYSKIS